MYTVTLTDEQYERLTIIIASHIDLLIQPKLDEAMKRKNEQKVSGLLETKKLDQGILQSVYQAKRS